MSQRRGAACKVEQLCGWGLDCLPAGKAAATAKPCQRMLLMHPGGVSAEHRVSATARPQEHASLLTGARPIKKQSPATSQTFQARPRSCACCLRTVS